jgi:hypothetical protein
MRSTPSRRRATLVALASASGLVAGVGALAPTAGNASSHREAPYIGTQPQLDNTDVYAFTSPDDPSRVTFVANWTPFEEPNGGPNFYPFSTTARHDINIDSNGDAKPDLTYRWTFQTQVKNKATFLYNTGVVSSLTDPALNVTQTYNVDAVLPDGTSTRIVSGGKVAPSVTGRASMPDYGKLRAEAIASAPVKGGGSSYAGQTEDPFFLDLRVFDLLYGADFSEVGQDTLQGYNVNTVVLSVPKTAVALKGDPDRNPVIGVWSDTDVPKITVLDSKNGGTMAASGEFVQVSRLGNPLVNEVVIPIGQKDRFNLSTPDKDTQFAANVLSPEVPRLVEAIYGIKAPAAPRNDLAEVFLTGICKTCGPIGGALGADLNSQKINKDAVAGSFVASEMLRLNLGVPVTASPNRLGALGGDFQGYPNGRRLGDDVLDIELSVLEGALPPYSTGAQIGDGVDSNDRPFSTTFPYVALPHDQAVNTQ